MRTKGGMSAPNRDPATSDPGWGHTQAQSRALCQAAAAEPTVTGSLPAMRASKLGQVDQAPLPRFRVRVPSVASRCQLELACYASIEIWVVVPPIVGYFSWACSVSRRASCCIEFGPGTSRSGKSAWGRASGGIDQRAAPADLSTPNRDNLQLVGA